MSFYMKTATLEYPLYEGDIRLEYPDIASALTGDSFPCPATYAKVTQQIIPVECGENQYFLESAPIIENGIWKTTWAVLEKPVGVT